MRFGLVLTNDWELFGDGSGDYYSVQQRPLEQAVQCVREHGAKLTVMAEVGQQWAHLDAGESWASEIAQAWEETLRNCIRARMDVQLHLHPQWLAARRNGRSWQMDYAHWTLASLDSETLARTLERGKAYLENLLRAVRPAYRCRALRAGSLCIQPSEGVIRALRAARIDCDTSVVKGLYDPPLIDFRRAYSCVRPWKAHAQNILRATSDPDAITEFPMASVRTWLTPLAAKILAPRSFYRWALCVNVPKEEMDWFDLQRQWIQERYPMSRRVIQKQNRRSVSWWVAKFLTPKIIQLDYDLTPPTAFVAAVNRILQRPEIQIFREEDTIVPIMASGHVKIMPNCDNLKRILEKLRLAFGDRLSFWTLSEALDYWQPRLA